MDFRLLLIVFERHFEFQLAMTTNFEQPLTDVLSFPTIVHPVYLRDILIDGRDDSGAVGLLCHCQQVIRF